MWSENGEGQAAWSDAQPYRLCNDFKLHVRRLSCLTAHCGPYSPQGLINKNILVLVLFWKVK